MALSKVSEIRQLSDADLSAAILQAKRKLFDLRFQQATRQPFKSHEFKHVRHRLGQLMTVERERQLQGLATPGSAQES
jgi:large subunit ribosomal protein L29